MPRRMTQEEFEQRVKDYTNDSVQVISQYVNKKTKVKVKCKTCGFEWEISPASLMPSTTDRYSFQGCPECKYTTFNCAYCGKTVRRLKSDLLKGEYHYCSRECGNRHKNELRALGGEWDNAKSSYRIRAFNVYPHKCMVCGWDEDERILEVHHLDENRQHNDISNLSILCPTCHRKITLGYYILTDDFKLVKK